MEVAIVALGLVAVGLVLGVVALWQRVRNAEADRASALTDAASALGRTPASLSDAVTTLVARRDASERRTEFIERAVERSTGGVVVLDRNLDVQFATAAAQRVVAGGPGAAEAAVALRGLARSALDGRGTVEVRLDVTGTDPRSYLARAEAIPTDVGTGVAVLLDDVTDRERVEAIRRDFVANVSHELKTPAGALAVLAEALRDAEDPATRQRLAGRMGEEVHRIARLVDDLLDLSTVEADDGNREQVDMRAVAEEARRAAAIKIEQADADVIVEAAGDLRVRGDRRQLVSAVANLVDNAVVYSAFRGKEDRRVWVRIGRADDAVVVEVEDRGIGIAPAHLDRIFERFYRVDRGRSRDRGGTGLGLAIVRHVALSHGGDVEVESSPGAGSTFRLRLPAAEAAP